MSSEPARPSLRILYHHRTQGRGAEKLHIAHVVAALRAMGHVVTVLSPPGIDPMANTQTTVAMSGRRSATRTASVLRWVAKHVPYVMFELAEVAYNVVAYIRLQRLVSKERFDFIYERYAFYLIAGAMVARRNRIPFVLEANEVNGVEARNRRQVMPTLCGMFERALLRRCLAIHTVSSYLKDLLVQRGVAPGSIVVSPNGFDVDASPPPGRSPVLAHRLGLAHCRVIGFVGWFSNWDRLDFLMDVFAALPQTTEPIKLLLIGDGPMVAQLRRQAAELGVADRVHFTGPIPRHLIHEYIGLLDVAVLPHSNSFGSPMVMFEFMAAQVPIAAPRLPPILDVHAGGDTAMLFEPLDARKCREAIQRLIEHPHEARQMAERAHAKLVANHTWLRNAQKIVESLHLDART